MKLPAKIAATRANLESRTERNGRLSQHEQKIERGLKLMEGCVFDIGKELTAIQEEKDFPDATFEAYIQRRWSRTRSWAYMLMEGTEIKAELPANVQNFVQTPSQARALKAAPKKERAVIIKSVAAEGKVTAKAISEKIEETRRPEPIEADFAEYDPADVEIPKAILSELRRSQTVSDSLAKPLQDIKRILDAEDIAFAEIDRAEALEAVKELQGMLKQIRGEYVCPVCAGKKCKVCFKRGYVSKFFYKQNIGKK